ncbi:MAG TPA: Rieske 2Fe-2S domain-containing protein, partial [Myxococcaceae bacterium]
MSEPLKASGPELSGGIDLSQIPDGGMLTAQVQGEPVVAVRRGEEVFVLAATCGHYGGPLWDGVFLGTELHCPWHHARFDVRTGDCVNPPSPRGISTWAVVREGSKVRTGARREPTAARVPIKNTPSSVLIVGAGAAGDACAEQLRRRGYEGP